MANKKISQLAGTLPKEIVSGSYLFASAAGNAGAGYETKKITAQEIAEYVFTGDTGGGFPATQLSGTKNVYFNKSDWNAAGVGENFPYLQVDLNDGGRLVTGSGIVVPEIGDNMGNCVATTTLNMQNKNITGVHSVNFYGMQNSLIQYNNNIGYMGDIKVQAAQDLTLSGFRHVSISGQGLDLASTPISGDVTITGGNLEIDRAHKLIVNEITTYGTDTAAGSDPPVIHISGAAAFKSIDATDDIVNDIYSSSSSFDLANSLCNVGGLSNVFSNSYDI